TTRLCPWTPTASADVRAMSKVRPALNSRQSAETTIHAHQAEIRSDRCCELEEVDRDQSRVGQGFLQGFVERFLTGRVLPGQQLPMLQEFVLHRSLSFARGEGGSENRTFSERSPVKTGPRLNPYSAFRKL